MKHGSSIGFLVLLFLVLLWGLWSWYDQPHQNMNGAKASVVVDAQRLFAAYSNDEASANAQYLDQVVQVSGIIARIEQATSGLPSIVLATTDGLFGVICQLDEQTKHPTFDYQAGDAITLKGMCTGMLMDVVLVRCVIVP
ncbi:MAG: hypothetical protein AAGD05_14925 [Bacteroidota bacterium]